MPLIFCLVDILTQFRPLFNRQNFALFCTFIVGLITHRHRATLTGIYQAVRPKVGYGSLVKFLSRGKWDADAVAKHLIKLLQQRFDNYVYVYDETPSDKDRGEAIWTPFLQKSSLPKAQHQSIEVSLRSSVWRVGVALYHRDRDDSVSGVGEPDMSQDPSGQQWVGTEADLLPNPAWTDYL